MPAYVRTSYLATTAIDDATRPILAEFEHAAARREEALQALRYASPAIIVHGFFNDVTGTSSARHRRYMAQARALKATYARQAGPYIVAGRHLPANEVAALPQFRFEDEPLPSLIGRHAGALAFLAALTAVLAHVADRRLRRAERHIGAFL